MFFRGKFFFHSTFHYGEGVGVRGPDAVPQNLSHHPTFTISQTVNFLKKSSDSIGLFSFFQTKIPIRQEILTKKILL